MRAFSASSCSSAALMSFWGEVEETGQGWGGGRGDLPGRETVLELRGVNEMERHHGAVFSSRREGTIPTSRVTSGDQTRGDELKRGGEARGEPTG
jgi:hypothetical protein